jgi:citrate lyase beta subunit
MRNNYHNIDFDFVKEPVKFNKFTDKKLLQFCLGATLYMPGTKHIFQKIKNKKMTHITSMVMCFEDSIKEQDLGKAEENVLDHLEKIQTLIENDSLSHDEIPLIFLRVRNTDQFRNFTKRLNFRNTNVLSGFVFPKFHSYNANEYLSTLNELNTQLNSTLYAMPIFEGSRIAYKETRLQELLSLKEILDQHKDLILNLRVGGTDFSALFSVRRGINYSVYDILTVRDCLADILNVFGRSNDEYIISGPVWEYFLAYNDDNINQLLNRDVHKSIQRGESILNDAIDGLIREVILDKANGFVGKTIIHPSHAKFVNALQTITKEEYEDALQIVNTSGGVIKSSKSNKMNEINPHKSWAKKVIMRAEAYGVVEDVTSFFEIISKKSNKE